MKVMVGLLLLAITYWIVVDGYRRLEEARGRIAWQRAVEAAEAIASLLEPSPPYERTAEENALLDALAAWRKGKA